MPGLIEARSLLAEVRRHAAEAPTAAALVDEHGTTDWAMRLRAARPSLQLTHVYASKEPGAVLTVKDGKEGFDATLLDGGRVRLVDGRLEARRTARTMLGYVGHATPVGEWVATGDLLEVIGERADVRGRSRDIISVGGHEVNLVEVEDVVREVAGVLDVHVVGHRSSILGAIPKAVVVAAPGTDEESLRADNTRHCETRLAKHMTPRLHVFTDRIERSAAQKVVRKP